MEKQIKAGKREKLKEITKIELVFISIQNWTTNEKNIFYFCSIENFHAHSSLNFSLFLLAWNVETFYLFFFFSKCAEISKFFAFLVSSFEFEEGERCWNCTAHFPNPPVHALFIFSYNNFPICFSCLKFQFNKFHKIIIGRKCCVWIAREPELMKSIFCLI